MTTKSADELRTEQEERKRVAAKGREAAAEEKRRRAASDQQARVQAELKKMEGWQNSGYPPEATFVVVAEAAGDPGECQGLQDFVSRQSELGFACKWVPSGRLKPPFAVGAVRRDPDPKGRAVVLDDKSGWKLDPLPRFGTNGDVKQLVITW